MHAETVCVYTNTQLYIYIYTHTNYRLKIYKATCSIEVFLVWSIQLYMVQCLTAQDFCTSMVLTYQQYFSSVFHPSAELYPYNSFS